MASFLPPEVWTLIFTYASGFPRWDPLLPGQHLKAALKPFDTHAAAAHKKINGICTSCALHHYDQKVLTKVCLVAKQCYDSAVTLLYRDPVIPTEGGRTLLLRTLVEQPQLGPHVRWLSLQGFVDSEETGRFGEQVRPSTDKDKLFLHDRLPQAFIHRYDELAGRSEQSEPFHQLAPGKADEQTCLATILSFLPNLRKTSLVHSAGEACAGLLPDSLTSLTFVEITHVPALFTDRRFQDLRWLAKAAPNISTLILKDLTITPRGMEDESYDWPIFANVKCLCVVKCLITESQWSMFLQSFPKIEQLDFLRPRHVFAGDAFANTLADYSPHLRDLRVQFINPRGNYMRFGQELAKIESLQRLWMPFVCLLGSKEDFKAEDFVTTLPRGLRHLSLLTVSAVEDEMCLALQRIAVEARAPDSRFQDLRSVLVTGWSFDVGMSGPTSRRMEVEESVVGTGKLMNSRGVRLTIEGGVTGWEDHYMGLDRVVRRYGEGDERERETDENLMKGHSLGEYGTMARWCTRQPE